MPLTDDQACSVARITLSKYSKRIGRVKNIPINEFFNQAFVAAKASKNEASAMLAARYAVYSLFDLAKGKGDASPGSRSSRYKHDEHKYVRDKERIKTDEADILALRIDLARAFFDITSDELILLQLRIVQGLTQREVAKLLNITIDVEQGREHKLMNKLKQALTDWRQ